MQRQFKVSQRRNTTFAVLPAPDKKPEVAKMKTSTITKSIISLLGVIAVLALAYGIDVLIGSLKVTNAQTFRLNLVIVLTYPLTQLAMALSLLTLFWYLDVRAPQRRIVSFIVLLVGLGSLFYGIQDVILHILPAVRFLTATGALAWSSAFVAFMGLWGLLRPALPSSK